MLLQPLAERAVAAEQHQQVVAHHGGRQHHRQREHGVEKIAADKAFAREYPAHGDAEHQVQQRGKAGDFEREKQRGESVLE